MTLACAHNRDTVPLITQLKSLEFRTECRLKNGIGQSQQAIIYVHVKLPGVIGRGVVVNLVVGVGSPVN